MNYEEKIAELVAKREELQEQEYTISHELRGIEDNIEELKRKQMETIVSDLSEEEENWNS